MSIHPAIAIILFLASIAVMIYLVCRDYDDEIARLDANAQIMMDALKQISRGDGSGQWMSYRARTALDFVHDKAKK